MRGWKNIFHTNGKQNKAGVAIIVSDKIDLKIKNITRDKEGHYIMIKGSIQEEDISIVNIYAPNIGQRLVTLYRRQGLRPSPRKRNAKKAKWLSEEALQIVVKRREAKSKGEKERYTHLNAEFQRIARRDKKAFLSDQWKEIENNNRMGNTRDLVKKISDIKGIFHAKMGTKKDRNGMDLTEAEAIRRGGKNTQKNCTKKITTQIIMMV